MDGPIATWYAKITQKDIEEYKDNAKLVVEQVSEVYGPLFRSGRLCAGYCFSHDKQAESGGIAADDWRGCGSWTGIRLAAVG